MRGRAHILLLCVHAACLYAKEYDKAMEQAYLSWQSAQFDQAIAVYAELLEKPMDAAKKARVRYNIASSLLAKGDYQAAINAFNAIGPLDAPYVAAKMQYNLGLAHAKQALKSQNQFRPNIEKAFYHYGQALLAVKKSWHAECRLQKFFGKKDCLATPALENLQKQIEQQMASLRALAKPQNVENGTATRAPLELERALNEISADISLMSHAKLPQNQQKEYLALFLAKQQTVFGIWQTVENVFKQTAALDLLEQAKQSYTRMYQLFAKGRWQESEQSLEIAKQALGKAIITFFGQDLLKVRLEYILATTQMAIELGLHPNAIQKLHANYVKVQAIAQNGSTEGKETLNLIQYPLKRAAASLQEAITYTQHSHTDESNLFLNISLSWLHDALFKLQSQTAKTLLHYLIKQQELCLQLSNGSSALQSEELIEQTKLCQAGLVAKLDHFMPLVYQEQVQQYKNGICQATPWNEVLPLFIDGQKQAKKALNLITAAKQDVAAAQQRELLSWQHSALEYWNLAEEAMDNPSPGKKADCQTTAKSPQKADSSPADKHASSMQSALELLQGMQQDDHQPLPKKPLQESDKPW